MNNDYNKIHDNLYVNENILYFNNIMIIWHRVLFRVMLVF